MSHLEPEPGLIRTLSEKKLGVHSSGFTKDNAIVYDPMRQRLLKEKRTFIDSTSGGTVKAVTLLRIGRWKKVPIPECPCKAGDQA